jgi:hypothetical protein
MNVHLDIYLFYLIPAEVIHYSKNTNIAWIKMFTKRKKVKCVFVRLHLWSSGQSSWLQIQRPGFDSRHYQIFWEVVGLEWGPLSPVSTTEELLERKNGGSGLEGREYGREDPLRWPRDTLSPQKLALTSPTSGDRSVSRVCSWTQTTKFGLVWFSCLRQRTASVV